MDLKYLHKKFNHDFQLIFETLTLNNIEVLKHWQIDHICYRVETLIRYNEIKEDFLKFSTLLGETEVNGRPICTFKLDNPFELNGFSIDLIELPAPKKNNSYKEGFEHIEVVCDLSFRELSKKYSSSLFQTKYNAKDYNAEFAISLDPYAIKFHQNSLESVNNLESNFKTFEALNKSQVLSIFKEYEPLVVGEAPLGLSFEDSKLSILLFSDNLKLVLELLNVHFSHYHEYQVSEIENGFNIFFNFFEVSFHLFVTNDFLEIKRQIHLFQIQERLLKMGNEKYKMKVKDFMRKNKDLNLCFSEALKEFEIATSVNILDLYFQPEVELKNIFSNSF